MSTTTAKPKDFPGPRVVEGVTYYPVEWIGCTGCAALQLSISCETLTPCRSARLDEDGGWSVVWRNDFEIAAKWAAQQEKQHDN